MAGLPRHIATRGLDVATLGFRYSRLWAGLHDLNAADIVALARHLNEKRVIYAGFSAGGFPRDPMCALLCGRVEQRNSRQEIQSSILGLATASVLYQAGLDTDARSRWESSWRVLESTRRWLQFRLPLMMTRWPASIPRRNALPGQDPGDSVPAPKPRRTEAPRRATGAGRR